MNNIYFVLGLIGVQIILPVSSSKKGLDEDEIKREGYLPMHLINVIDYQIVTNHWFIYGSFFPKLFRTLEMQ